MLPLSAGDTIVLFDLAFDSYLPSLGTPGGLQDRALLAEMRSQAPSQELADLVQEMTYGFMDIAVGFDVQPAEPGTPEGMANVRGSLDPEASVAMLLAVRTGVRGALEGRDPELVGPPIAQFWVEHPDYAPMHTGRCFPHGHVDGAEDPASCQVEELERKLHLLVSALESP
jgi:hypothetical protein